MTLDNAIIKMLRCPVCDAKMTANDNLRLCHCMGQKAHSFDFSRSGYLNLGGAHAGEGDKKPAIIARRKFLDFGYYSKLSDKINDILDSLPSKQVLDAGCGEGYYTNRMAQGRSVFGIDLSKDGIDYGARRAKQLSMTANVGFAVASVFNIPVSDAQMDVVVNIFAPCAEDEYCRVLKPGGYLLLVGASHRYPDGKEDFVNIYGDWFAYNFGVKDGYYYRGAFLDCVQAVRFMATRESSDMTQLFAEGSSQGGALSYAVAALSDYPFTAIAPCVAFLGDFPDYFNIVSWPSG